MKQNYDAVIIDTPPVVFVAEIFQMREIIDFNIVVVRQLYTPKAVLKMALAEIKDHRMKEIGIIFNNIYGQRKYGIDNWFKWKYEQVRQNSIQKKPSVIS